MLFPVYNIVPFHIFFISFLEKVLYNTQDIQPTNHIYKKQVHLLFMKFNLIGFLAMNLIEIFQIPLGIVGLLLYIFHLTQIVKDFDTKGPLTAILTLSLTLISSPLKLLVTSQYIILMSITIERCVLDTSFPKGILSMVIFIWIVNFLIC